MSQFKDYIILVTGGTGLFRNAVLNRFLQTDIGEIRIFQEKRKSITICVVKFKPKCLPQAAEKLSFLLDNGSYGNILVPKAPACIIQTFYRVPCDKRRLNYDKYFSQGDSDRNTLTEFNSNNTEILNVEHVKKKLLTLQYVKIVSKKLTFN